MTINLGMICIKDIGCILPTIWNSLIWLSILLIIIILIIKFKNKIDRDFAKRGKEE